MSILAYIRLSFLSPADYHLLFSWSDYSSLSSKMSTRRNEATYRYAHYAIPNPDFDKCKDMENPFANSEGLSVPAMCEIMAHMPVTFPRDERDFPSVAIRHQTIRARDDAELNLRIYKDKDVGKDPVLLFVAHGGGWILGDHNAEEAMNRLVAEKTNSVVVRANYRLFMIVPDIGDIER